MMKPFFILIFGITFFSCKIVSKNYEVNSVPYELSTIDSSFHLRIIYYAPGFHCGSFANASVTIGTDKNNDTIRVLSLCNTDSTYFNSLEILVIPRTPPEFNVSLPFFADKSIQEAHYITIFGKIEKIDSVR